MRKPQLCLALSVTLALLQANLLPALSEPASPSIWQKLAGVSEGKPAQKTGSSAVVTAKPLSRASNTVSKSASAGVGQFSAHGVAASGVDPHAMLFLKSKDSGSSPASRAPAAALTIHPSLPLTTDQTASASSQEPPTLVAMNEIPTGQLAVGKVSPKQLIAQLAPDQIVAQGDQAITTATPIPPVVSGTVDLEEFKPSNVIDLKVSQSRTFKLRNKIVRTSISDPAIAEPVVVAENQLVLLGKAPGGATLVIWDDAGNSVAVDLKVSRDYSGLQATLREIDPRIIVKPFSVGGGDRVLLLGDVDHPESVIRAFSCANAFMDDRNMNIIAANSRIISARIGEQGAGGGGGGGGQAGQIAQLSQVDKYVFFANTNNNVGKAQVMVSDGGRVTSLIKVRKVPLIVLHCTFMEMNTAAARELGVQLGLAFTNETFSFALGGNNLSGTTINPFLITTSPGLTNRISTGQGLGGTTQPVSFNVASAIQQQIGATQQIATLPISALGQGVLNGPPAGLVPQSILFGVPGGASFISTGLANLFTSANNFAEREIGRWSINPTVQGIITHNRARVLAEPTLVTISGERAAFLAGGEIPIVQSIATAGTAQQSVVFEPFGLRLNMIPVLLENGTINIQVSPEERLLSQANALNLFGAGTSAIPGFTVRKTQTIVEMKAGQELFISGLVSANSGREVDKTPLLGEVPVLGALYRSKSFVKNESELVVAIRPEIIIPGNPGQLKVPEEISKTEGVRDTNFLQVEPTIIDERYMTSGRADRAQKLPGILPPGSPIPDAQ